VSEQTARPRVFGSLAELAAAAGQVLGHSRWHGVTQARIDAFAAATDDHQWIHVDPERASHGPFGASVAHGYLTLSLLPMLVSEVYVVEGVAMGADYGANKLRFPAPVRVGSRVRAAVELVDVSPTPQGLRTIQRVTVELDGSDKPACVMESVSLYVAG
jgi:acyl dehydratase